METARFVRIEEDGLDCETGTIVVRIETIATNPVYDLDTGVLLIAASFGSGQLVIE